MGGYEPMIPITLGRGAYPLHFTAILKIEFHFKTLMFFLNLDFEPFESNSNISLPYCYMFVIIGHLKYTN